MIWRTPPIFRAKLSCPQDRSFKLSRRISSASPACAAILSGFLLASSAIAQNLGSRTFHLYEDKLDDVGYGVDGMYSVLPGEVGVTIQGGSVVAHKTVSLHSLRFGLCGSSNIFLTTLSLNDRGLVPKDLYTLPLKTVVFPLPKDVSAPMSLCSALVESNGKYHVARVYGPPILTPLVAPRQGDTEFWRRNAPAKWSERERQEFLTKSPWVHYFSDIQVPSDACVPGPRGCHHSMVPAGSLIIRWESANLIRDVLARIGSKEYSDALARYSKDYYIIAVIRIRGGDSRNHQTDMSGHWSWEQEEAPSTARSLAYSHNRLLRFGREALRPARVESGETSGSSIDLLMFPRSLALEDADGDIHIETKVTLGMSPSTINVSFSLKTLGEGFERGL